MTVDDEDLKLFKRAIEELIDRPKGVVPDSVYLARRRLDELLRTPAPVRVVDDLDDYFGSVQGLHDPRSL